MNVQTRFPHQNRVLPTGEITAIPARGALMGNRGCLHNAAGRLGKARWRTKAWISCTLDFGDRHREVMAPGRYTELFFLDEAVALAAGHRPCCECRREAAAAFRTAWKRAIGSVRTASEIDAVLHRARLWPGTRIQRRFSADIRDLPAGTFVLYADRPHLVRARDMLPWSPEGYDIPIPHARIPITVLTPNPVLKVLAAGYRPEVSVKLA